MKHTKGPLDKLKHHVTGAIERGEKQAIIAVIGHTKGPWHKVFHPAIKGDSIEIKFYPNELEIRYANSESSNRAEANAALIAAAPEMLEAICSIRCLPNFEAMLRERFSKPTADALITQLDETIQKARGAK